MKQGVPKGSRAWQRNDSWNRSAHPWMTAYCGFFALEMKRRFPHLAFALEYSLYPDDPKLGAIADHALVHDQDRFYDARGLLLGYQPLDEDEVLTLTYLDEEDLKKSGLLLPVPGLRDLPEETVLQYAKKWSEENGFTVLECLPQHFYQE